jgi:hypothetical protein
VPNQKNVWIQKLADLFKINIHVFQELNIPNLKNASCFQHRFVVSGVDSDARIPLAVWTRQNVRTGNLTYHWAWMTIVTTKLGLKLPLLETAKCLICCRWKKFQKSSKDKNIEEHLKTCVACVCGRAYTIGEGHEATCAYRAHWTLTKELPNPECKRHEVAKSKKPCFQGYLLC